MNELDFQLPCFYSRYVGGEKKQDTKSNQKKEKEDTYSENEDEDEDDDMGEDDSEGQEVD